MYKGLPVNRSCVKGFENAGCLYSYRSPSVVADSLFHRWLMGTSGNSFTDPGLLLEISTSLPEAEQALLNSVLSLIPDSIIDTGLVCPFLSPSWDAN